MSNSKNIISNSNTDKLLCSDHCADLGLLEFVASLVDSLAWPLLIVLLALIFRKSISGLLGKLKKVDWGNRTAEFEQELSKIEQEVDELATDDGLVLADAPAFQTPELFPEDLSDAYPPMAVIQGWIEVERELKSLAERSGISVSGKIFASSILRKFGKKDILSPSTIALIDELRVLRNKAAHGGLGEISQEQALRYYNSASEIRSYLRSVELED